MPFLNKDSVSQTQELIFLKEEFPKLVDTLRNKKMLPALVFVFDRTYCTDLTKEAKDSMMMEIKLIVQTPEYKAQEAERKKIEVAEMKLMKAEQKKADKKANASGDPNVTSLVKANLGGSSCDALKEYWNKFPNQTLISKNYLSDEDATYLLERIQGNTDFINLMKFGISYHHAGNDNKMRSATEMMFREKFLNLVVSTTTLAQGIHMPCQTVVFAGDSVFLNSLSFHQCSGRAGRRGFDTEGKVIFFGLKESKISRLLNSNLPLIFGNTPISISLILRLFSFTCDDLKDDDRKDAVARAIGCLRNPLVTHRLKHINIQLQGFFLYASDFLLKQEFIDENGHPVGFAGLAAHLSYQEPYNFVFCHLLQAGVLHKLITRNSKMEITEDSLHALMTTVAFLFGRFKKVYPGQNQAVLPKLPTEVAESLQGFSKVLNRTYRNYITTVATLTSPTAAQVSLPLSGLQYECKLGGEVEPLAEQAGVTRTDDGDNEKICSNLRADILSDTMPEINPKAPVNGAALAFYKSGAWIFVYQKF